MSLGIKKFVDYTTLTANEINQYLMQQSVMVFASSAARASAFSSAAVTITEGMVSYLLDTNVTQYYDGAAWQSYLTGGSAVTSLAGTANQITVSASTGAVTVSLPSAVTIASTFTAYNGTRAITLGGWTNDSAFAAIQSNNGFLLLGHSSNTNIYLRTSGAGEVHIGANNTSAFVVGTTNGLLAGNMIAYNGTSAITLGGWTNSGSYASAQGNKGYMLLGNTIGDAAIYLRSSTAGSVNIGAQDSNTLVVGNGWVTTSGYFAAGGTGLTEGISTNNWFRSTGNSGWYNASYGLGIFCQDATWVRTYNSANFLVTGAQVRAGNFSREIDWAVYAGTTLTSFPLSGAWYITKSSSSRKLKHDIVDLEDGTSLLKQLRPRTYKWNPKDDGDDIHKALVETKLNYGFIAEEVADISKNIAHFTPPNAEWWDKEITLESFDEWEVEMWDVNAVVSITVKTVQELLERIETLENERRTE
jgi:hypothetical protein